MGHSGLKQLVASSGVAQLILFMGNVLIALLHQPESLGEFGFYVTVASLFSFAAALRLDYFAFFLRTDDPARSLAPTCGAITATGAVLFCVLLALLSVVPVEVAISLSLSILSFSVFYLVSQNVLLMRDYGLYSKGRVIHGTSFIVLLLATQPFGGSGLLLAYCGAQIIASGFMCRVAPPRLFFSESALSLSLSLLIRKRVANLVTTAMQLLSPALPLLIGHYYFSNEDLGVFFWLSQIFAGGGAIIKRSLSGYLSAELMREGAVQQSVVAIARKTIHLGLFLPLVAMLGMLFVSSLLADLTDKWKLAFALIPPFALLFVADALLQPMGALLPALDEEKLYFFVETTRVVLVAGCFMAAVDSEAGIQGFAWMYAIVMALFYMIGALLFYKLAYRNMVKYG